jgi:sialic acid synthase SpsE
MLTFSKTEKRPYIIAEIGVNHENDIELAMRQIEMAKQGGADAAKFQTYKAEKLAILNSPAYWDTTKESTPTQYELFKKFDGFGLPEYRKLASHAQKVGIDFMTTAFDFEAVDEMDGLVAVHKVASADITNVPLLRKIAGKHKPVILSTGAATFEEVSAAVEVLLKSGATELALMHCVLNYPTPTENAHLARIGSLQEKFPQHVIGYSDHTLPGDFCYPVVLSYALGARIIEKHFTHDRSLPGNDHYHAMDVESLRTLRAKLEEARLLIGGGNEAQFLENQSMAIKHARRSIVAIRPLGSGHIISESDLTVKRPAHGISPAFWDSVIGRRLLRAVDEDAPLTWQHFE